MSGLSAPLDGILRAESQVSEAAKRIARLPAAFTSLLASSGGSIGAGAPTDTVDLSAESVALLQARNVADANIVAAQTMDQVQQHLISMLG